MSAGGGLPRIAVLICVSAVALFAQPEAEGRRLFGASCAGCHGAQGEGGERGPDIVSGPRAKGRTAEELARVIVKGIPERGMPPIALDPAGVNQIVEFLQHFTQPAASNPSPGDAHAGKAYFFGAGGCANCHSIGGRGGLAGPPLSSLPRTRTRAEIERSLRNPGERIAEGYRTARVQLRAGGGLHAFVRNESGFDLQLLTFDGTLRMLRREEVAKVAYDKQSRMPPVQASAAQFAHLMAFLTRLPEIPEASADIAKAPGSIPFGDIVEPKGDWLTYHGRLSGNRHSPLDQITPGNVNRLAPRWTYTIPSPRSLEMTPIVAGGVMYVSTVNEVVALDARSGRKIWQYQRPRSRGLIGDASTGINRGVAILGDRVFLATDNAHLIALHRVTGELLWDVEMADSRDHYGATSAPLVVKDLVISGVSGGDEGVRGFLAAYKASTGERLWRFWTVPAPGEPGSDTWIGNALPHGCAATWLTGSYDSETNLLFWPTGNPCPDYDSSARKGDNLYSDSVLAFQPETGKLVWYYQFTPHDLFDWDATETLLLANAQFQGRERKLLMQGNRNGFFYVLDRTNGELLLAKPFVKQLTWSSGIGKDGRPQRVQGMEPTPAGTQVCPAVEGATNWMSTAYNPSTNLFYLQALEKCNIFTVSPQEWVRGQEYYGGTTRTVPGEPGQKFLRAIRPQTGEIVWELPQSGPATSWGGVLSTAGGLLFYGDDSGAFAAVEAGTGKPLWNFHTSAVWKASPMTYLVDGKQYVAVAFGQQVIAFALTGGQ